ncbi:hypothetical protein V496_08398 [Pseudogymnoascus sp. VKM F-4515 (FW-2607)]|nr:hypothetical protein V496_08398 [Pseudogymnoascus sp. VKM F-4515 (FW-2607)]
MNTTLQYAERCLYVEWFCLIRSPTEEVRLGSYQKGLPEDVDFLCRLLSHPGFKFNPNDCYKSLDCTISAALKYDASKSLEVVQRAKAEISSLLSNENANLPPNVQESLGKLQAHYHETAAARTEFRRILLLCINVTYTASIVCLLDSLFRKVWTQQLDKVTLLVHIAAFCLTTHMCLEHVWCKVNT